MVICICDLLPHPAKVPNFQYMAWWYSIDQDFYADDVEKTRDTLIRASANLFKNLKISVSRENSAGRSEYFFVTNIYTMPNDVLGFYCSTSSTHTQLKEFEWKSWQNLFFGNKNCHPRKKISKIAFLKNLSNYYFNGFWCEIVLLRFVL
jgi:hypothetical protein